MRAIKKTYKCIRALMPNCTKGIITKSLYRIGIKPTVNKSEKTVLQKGVVVFSADFEMAWAFRYSKTKREIAEQMGLHERVNVPILLKLFEKYNIPITWAIVGHLFLNSCKRENGVAHQEMKRPHYFENRNWNFDKGDWYDADPCSDVLHSPAWYAPDLISMIRESKVNHEIGCHTFSHIDCTYSDCSKELLESELEKCIQIAKAEGIKLNSLVFPGGTLGNFRLIKSLGFKCYRKPMEYNVDLPQRDDSGLISIPSSYGMDKPSFKCSANTCIQIARSYVDCAIKHKKVAHLWFHPSMDTWYLNNVLPHILSYVDSKRRSGQLEICTMNEISEKYEGIIQN